LYLKIGIVENIGDTEESGISVVGAGIGSDIINTDLFVRNESEYIRGGSDRTVYETDITEYSGSGNSGNSQNTQLTKTKIKQVYLKHAVKCALSTIICLIIYQIFFYYYGQLFKSVGSTNEFIVLLIEQIK
jgi:hypothetical protein